MAILVLSAQAKISGGFFVLLLTYLYDFYSSSSKVDEYEAFSQAVKDVAKKQFNYTYDEPVNNFVANFHDAVSNIF